MSNRSDSIAERTALIEQYNPRTGDWLGDTRDILLRFLQEYFYQQPAGQNLFHFEPGDQDGEWTTAEVDSEVIISDQGSINTDTVEKRPAIIISRGPFQYGNLGLDNLLYEEQSTAKRTHTDMLSGSFVINCISRVGLEAERLALLVAKGLRVHRRAIQLAGIFQTGSVIRVGSESPANSLVSGDSDEDLITVPVSFPVFYQESWTVEEDATTLEQIVFAVKAVATTFSGSLLYPDSLDSDGNPDESSEGVIVSAWTLTAE